MKTISFFLASSISDLEFDRLAVGDFVNDLNNIYRSSDVFIRLYKCESDSLDHSISSGGSQYALDEIIKQSDICFVIFWRKVGDVTYHELLTALESYKSSGKPKIVVYFKKTVSNADQSEDILKVMQIIDNELLHYHREYDHIDSLKLGIVTQLQVNGFVKAELSVEENKIKCGSRVIVSTDKIPLFEYNEEYHDLLNEYYEITSKCNELQSAYLADKNNLKLSRELAKCDKRKQRIKEDLDELSSNILNIGNSIVSMTSQGGEITDKLKRAIACFDNGDYDGVLEVLNPGDIERDLAQLDVLERNIASAREVYIEEYRMLIASLKAKCSWSEVYDIYRKAVAQVMSHPYMKKDIVTEYAEFLFIQTKYGECIDICEYLIGLIGNGEVIPSKFTAHIYRLCGSAYAKDGNFEKALEKLELSLAEYKLLSESSACGDIEHALACIDTARIYYRFDRHIDAEQLYKAALNTLISNDDRASRLAAIEAEMSLADLYYQINRHHDAERMYIGAYEDCNDILPVEPSCKDQIARLALKLVHINYAIASHRRTDRHFVEVLRKRSDMIDGGVEVFAAFLRSIVALTAKAYCDTGMNEYADRILKFSNITPETIGKIEAVKETDFDYYDKRIDYRKLERYCEQALDIRRKQAIDNPEAYEIAVAETCIKYGEVLTIQGKTEEARRLLEESLQIQQRRLEYMKKDGSELLASTYCVAAELRRVLNDIDGACKYYSLAEKFYCNRGMTNELARTYNHHGRLMLNAGRKIQARELFFLSLELYLSLYVKSPGAYIDRVINTLSNALYEIDSDLEKRSMRELGIIR